MSELSPRFQPPEDRPKPPEPDRHPTSEPDLDDRFDRYDNVIDRVAAAMDREQRPERPPATVDYSPQSVIDRVAGPKVELDVDRPALQPVCDRAGRDLHDKVPVDRWRAADLPERAELAQEAHDLIRDRYGLTPRELEITSELKDGALGQFAPRSGRVAVSEQLLSEAEPSELLNTIAHENQHAAQEEIMAGRMPHPLGDAGKPEVEAWRAGELNYKPSDFWGTGYTYNPLEIDANNAGDGVEAGYRDARTETLEAQTETLKAQTERLEALAETQEARIEALEALVDTLSANRDPNERPRP